MTGVQTCALPIFGNGCGSRTAFSRMHRFLEQSTLFCLHTSLCIDNTKNLHRSSVERILRQCAHAAYKVEAQCAVNTPNALILANRTISNLFFVYFQMCRLHKFNYQCMYLHVSQFPECPIKCMGVKRHQLWISNYLSKMITDNKT